jgi:hypothetical protein
MANNTYIIRFADEASRAKFCRSLKKQPDVANKQMKLGEFLPDVIIHDVSEEELEKLTRLAGTQARFIGDFKHDLFSVR